MTLRVLIRFSTRICATLRLSSARMYSSPVDILSANSTRVTKIRRWSSVSSPCSLEFTEKSLDLLERYFLGKHSV